MSVQTETASTAARRQDKLNRAAVLARDTAHLGMEAAALVPRVPENKAAAVLVQRVGRSAAEVAGLLVEAGAVIPEWQARGERSERGGLDLSTLATLDTAATRELLALLEQAQAAAETVDAQQGNVLPPGMPLQPNESRGTRWAEDISNLAQRLRVEVLGAGAGRE